MQRRPPATAQQELRRVSRPARAPAVLRNHQQSEDKEDDDEAKIDQAFPGVFEESSGSARFLEPEGGMSEMVILRAGRRK